MSTILNTNGDRREVSAAANPDMKVALVTAEWNSHITYALRDGALEVLAKAGIRSENIVMESVPGTVELVNAAALFCRKDYDAVIATGVVIRGDTPHFDYVCMIAAEGTARLNAEGKCPVIFDVLTVDNEQQALDRAGGCLGNKGEEAAVAAIEMANLHFRARSL